MTTIQHKIADLETEQHIQLVKETFLRGLKEQLKLHQVYAPLYVKTGTGINDDLNGIEIPVTFSRKQVDTSYAIVHSLAKWKRMRLQELNLPLHQGIVTNMIALRPDETLSEIHSVMVDQWDWELHIAEQDRTLNFLKATVSKIYGQLKATECSIAARVGIIPVLPPDITFIHTEDLQRLYPGKTPKEREDIIVAKYGAVFLIGIGGALADGEPHDGRAPDYDDWSTSTIDGYRGLNGDILLWHPVLHRAFEVSSMGIRVDAVALRYQLDTAGAGTRKELPYHRALLQGSLPLSIGGGIGQSRLCMFMLRKSHIAEVQYCDN